MWRRGKHWLQISSVLISQNYILSKVLSADPIHALQLEHNRARTDEFLRYYTVTLPCRPGVVAFTPQLVVCISIAEGYGRTVSQR